MINQTDTPVDVYFDDVTVSLTPSPVVETTDYYPFGLVAQNFQREGEVTQNYKYNGKENIADLGLNWDDYGARMYMPEIGRWGVIDPLSEKSRRWSPYNYAMDNPIRFIDPDGKESKWIPGSDGKAISYTKDKEGNVSWSKNTTADVQRIGNAMMKSETGQKQFDQMKNDDIKTNLKIDSKTVEKTSESGEKKLVLAETVQGNFNEKDNYGRSISPDGKYEIKEATTTIHEGSINEATKQSGEYKGLDSETALGAVSTHESIHNSDKEQINQEVKAQQNGSVWSNKENKPNAVEGQYLKEVKKN